MNQLSPRLQGVVFLLITMMMWGSFTLLSRLSAHQSLNPWDLTALRFGVAFVVLLPIVVWRGQWRELCQFKYIALALLGGVGYCVAVYSGFAIAPAAHAAIWLNGFIPLCTAVAATLILQQLFDRHIRLSLLFMAVGLGGMVYVMSRQGEWHIGLGDAFYFVGAMLWGAYTATIKYWHVKPWYAMAGVAMWSAILFVPIYMLFLPKEIMHAQPLHIVQQGFFHGVCVVIIATLTYIAALNRLGAFQTGSMSSLAPFIAAVLAVPLLGEPLNLAVIIGLVGMGIGALQPWRWYALARANKS